MGKLKVIWSVEAKDKFLQIAQFYNQRNGNAKYSTRLYRMMKDALRLAARYPFMYPATSIPETRVFVCEYFKVFYSIHQDCLYVETVFDTRQDPNKLPY